jgi:predicted alpha/beta-fold hydrolase
VLIVLPGLTGGSHDPYVQHLAVEAARAGLRTVVFNSRGTADGPVTSAQFYSASFTGDMR